MLRATCTLTFAALVATVDASAQTVLHYWDFESLNEPVGGLVTIPVGTPDLSLHPTYGEAYPGSNQSLNSIVGGTSAGGGFLEADVFDGVSATALDFGTSSYSVSYWSYNPDDGDVRGPRIFDFLEGASVGSQVRTTPAGDWNLRIDDDLGGSMRTPPPVITQNVDAWTQVCINVDRGAGEVEAFIDGMSQGVVPLIDTGTGLPLIGAVFPSMDLQIGVVNGGSNPAQSQACGLDDLAFYDGLLDAQGITGLASGTLTPLDFLGSIGQPYCSPAMPNSTGLAGIITAMGSAFVASNDVTLAASDLPPAQFGYFLSSQTQGLFMPPNSQGFICLSSNIGRYQNDIIQGPTGSIQIDLTSIPVNPPQAVVPGDTWNFQCWYRDIGNTNNFTDAVSVTFQ